MVVVGVVVVVVVVVMVQQVEVVAREQCREVTTCAKATIEPNIGIWACYKFWSSTTPRLENCVVMAFYMKA